MTPAQAWYAVAILTIANVSGFVDRQILSLLVEPIKRDLQVTDTQVSLLMGLGFVVFYSLLGLPIGRWVDRGHRPRIVALGATVWSVMTMLTGTASSYWHLFLARIGVGAGEATLGPAAVSIIADQFPQKRLGVAMSTYMMGTFLGSGVAYALGAYVVGRVDKPGIVMVPLVGAVYPWQLVFFFVGLPGLLVALLALTIREPRASSPHAAQARTTAQSPFAEVIAYLRANARTVGALSLGFACSASVNYGVGAWLATFLIRTHAWTVQHRRVVRAHKVCAVVPSCAVVGHAGSNSVIAHHHHRTKGSGWAGTSSRRSPLRPARAVRPTRWMYCRRSRGRWALITVSTPNMSSPATHAARDATQGPSPPSVGARENCGGAPSVPRAARSVQSMKSTSP